MRLIHPLKREIDESSESPCLWRLLKGPAVHMPTILTDADLERHVSARALEPVVSHHSVEPMDVDGGTHRAARS